MLPTRALMMRQSPILRMAMPKQEQSAHTVSQRLRMIRKMPTELIPLAAVVGIAVLAAVYSMGKKFTSDTTLRLRRSEQNH